MLIKTFFFMRLFKSMSHLVTMMKQVFKDLQAFMVFFFILLWICSLIFNIIQLGNYENKVDEGLKNKLKAISYPGIEYKHIPRWARHWFSVLRISLGDFDFGESTDLEPFENLLYWLTWVILVTMTCIIFLNFIIAEVSESYNTVNQQVKGLIAQERTQLIKESEDMMFASSKKDPNKFPRYLIRRQIED